MAQENQQFKYFAFISYNYKDIEWGKRLQRELEHYRMPATLCSEHGWERTPIKPVFFAPSDIQPGGLTEELQERLKASRNLIVVCSPNSAQSKWVGQEIEFFHKLGRTKNIHFFIVDGVPNSGDLLTECFNPIVKELGLPEILGANVHEKIYRWSWMNKERAYVQLISKLLDVEFDAIWQRHKRLMIQKSIAWCFGAIFVIATILAVWFNSQPVDVRVKLNETTELNDSLPPLEGAVVTMMLANESKTDTLVSQESGITFSNVPRRFVGEQVRLTVIAPDSAYVNVDTTMILTKDLQVDIKRNPDYYGHVHFVLWDVAIENVVSNENLIISTDSKKYNVKTNSTGCADICIPLSEQRNIYKVMSSEDNILGTVSMPCGEDVIIMLEGKNRFENK